MKKLYLVILLLLLTTFTVAQELENDCFYYFYGQECEDCAAVDATIFGLSQSYPHLQIQKYEVYHNFQNFELLQQYYDGYGIEKKSRSIPVVFMKGNYLVGSKAINSLLEERVKDNTDPSCPSFTPEQAAVGILGEGETPNVLSTLTFSLITGDALRNMFAPGILALLLIFLAVLPLTKTKEDVIKTSAFYIAGIFLAYFLFSIGMLSFFYDSQVYYLFYKIIGFIAIMLGLMGVKSFFTTWKLVIPQEVRDYGTEALSYLLSPLGMFAFGLVGGMFTVAGVSSSFYLLRDLFMGNFMRGIVMPLQLYYVAVMLLIFVGLAVLFQVLHSSMEQAVQTQEASSDLKRERWKKHYQRVLNFSIRATLLVLGLFLLFL